MTDSLRKLLFTTHITFSIGWFGAVAAFLILNISALRNHDTQIIRSAYIAMDLLGWYIILPFCFGSLLTGLTQALFTQWGLFKHYWIAVKFFLTVGCTILLLLHMQSISQGTLLATATKFSDTELRDVGTMLLSKSAPALLVLFAIILISVYKPWGKIQFGKQNNNSQTHIEEKALSKKRWGLFIIIALAILFMIFIIKHILSGGMNH